MTLQPEAFFLSVGEDALGQRFCLYHEPVQSPAVGLVVYVHPFAEAMNKSRPMAALQSRAMARAGFAVLQIDLLGCGDSAGDFADASWAQWRSDVAHACRWLHQRHPGSTVPIWLWGLGLGALLAVDAAAQIDLTCNFLFWQPVSSGASALQQFLRLSTSGEMLAGKARGTVDQLRRQLQSAEVVEVVGYRVSPPLALGLEAATLKPPTARCRVEWFEVSSGDPPELSPAALRGALQWREAGHEVHTHAVEGPAFWQTTEIEVAPKLIDATVKALCSSASGRTVEA